MFLRMEKSFYDTRIIQNIDLFDKYVYCFSLSLGSGTFRRRRFGAGQFGAGYFGAGTIRRQNFFFRFVVL